jgi:surfactin synthase thioesterase subunit
MVCMAWAGGNSTSYRNWDLPDTEVIFVELPGRLM